MYVGFALFRFKKGQGKFALKHMRKHLNTVKQVKGFIHGYVAKSIEFDHEYLVIEEYETKEAQEEAQNKISKEEVSSKTLQCIKESVPSEVPGIAFLSGGQSEIEATENLNLINKNNNTSFIMTYSYGRALQQSAIKFWSKDIKDIKGTQNVFNHRAKMNTLAAQGKWSIELENK